MSFREDSRFSTWLLRIGVNTTIDFLAAERRCIPLDQHPLRADSNEPIAMEIVDDNNPEQLLATQQINGTVTKALKKLPKELRLAITLREFDGLSYEEIAAIMGCPIGTVRSRIFRARENISAILRPQSD
jgi:RNA polymerase sigma-70 factor, ECF subfamily